MRFYIDSKVELKEDYNQLKIQYDELKTENDLLKNNFYQLIEYCKWEEIFVKS